MTYNITSISSRYVQNFSHKRNEIAIMIKENQQLLNSLNILIEGIIIFLSMPIAYGLRLYLNDGVALAYDFFFYLKIASVASLMNIGMYAIFGLYHSFRTCGILSELWMLLKVTILGQTMLIAGLFILRHMDFSRWLLVFYFSILFSGVAIKRILLRILLRRWRKQGRNLKHVLIIGGGKTAERYLHSIKSQAQLGYLPSGYIYDDNTLKGVMRFGKYDKLRGILDSLAFDEVVIALEPDEYTQLDWIVNQCESAGAKCAIIPFCHAYLTQFPRIEIVDGLPLINIRKIPLENMANALLKRSFDIIISSVLLILLSPIMLITMVGVMLSSSGSVLFKQKRVGFNQKPFYMLKFRSMRINNTQQTGWSSQMDQRRTKFGSLIRKCSIDELPQLWNVLRGEMSLIGPRPELPHFVEQFREEIPLYMVKHQVRPGITGWAQINGFRGDNSISQRIDYDLYYIEHWSFALDLKILIKTACLGFLNQEQLTEKEVEVEK